MRYLLADSAGDPSLTEVVPYGVPMVQADQVAAGPTPITVGIIDSGLYDAHVDIGLASGRDLSGTGRWNTDACGHGTHVAGTIAATDNTTGVIGVYPGAPLVISKVFGDDCAWSYASDLVGALNDNVAQGAKVVNMSLGGSRSNRTERQAMDDAYASGVLLIAAAGNDGNTRTSYPAGYSSVMSVAAVDDTKTIASFSQQNSTVEIAAPGVSVLSTVPWKSTATLSAGGSTWSGSVMEGSATGSATGTVVDGELCAPTRTKGKPGTAAPRDWTGKVVLCQRGTYTFGEKADAVAAAGGVAAVIYNNTSGEFSGTLGAQKAIPVISLSQADGVAALGQVGKSGTVTAQLAKPADGYEKWDGTSMATPHVAGVAAKIWSHNPGWTASEIRQALTSTAQDLGAAGRDNAYGYGLVQAQAALTSLGG